MGLPVNVENLDLAAKAAALLPKGIELAKMLLSKFDNRAQYDFRIAHSKYCTNVINKYCRARTFFVRDEPQYLDEFYVPASLIRGTKTRVERANLDSMVAVGRRAIITGNGGSGKTIFMRHLLLDAIERGVGYPVFIELRSFNERSEVDLEGAIVSFMKEHGFPLSDDLALRSLHEGLLVVLLDGFDEVVSSKRKPLEKAIRRLGSTCASQIILSSRPDMVLEGWDGFGATRIAPLELEEACELVSRIRFDDEDEIKARFVSHLRAGLFNSHKYFLSNPLLLSIMLFTYGGAADIPKKFASFYEQAFTALFNGHDARKSGFKRPRQTDLDIYEFSRLFSAFSAITYEKRLFRFSGSDAIKYAKQALAVVAGRQVSSEGFVEDARQAVCLLIEDGLDLAYVHRSFQEFFVAKFIHDADEGLQKRYIKKIGEHGSENHLPSDNVLKILYEMAPALVEENYLLPGLERLFGDDAGRKLSVASWRRVIRRVLSHVQLHEKDVVFSVKDWKNLSVIFFADGVCSTRKVLGRQKVSADLSSHFDGATPIVLSRLSDKSPLWSDLGESPGTFSLSSLERLRLFLAEMRVRAQQRVDAVDSVFAF